MTPSAVRCDGWGAAQLKRSPACRISRTTCGRTGPVGVGDTSPVLRARPHRRVLHSAEIVRPGRQRDRRTAVGAGAAWGVPSAANAVRSVADHEGRARSCGHGREESAAVELVPLRALARHPPSLLTATKSDCMSWFEFREIGVGSTIS